MDTPAPDFPNGRVGTILIFWFDAAASASDGFNAFMGISVEVNPAASAT